MRAICLVTLVLLTAGCSSSRWAMDDRDYADKYSKPYGDDKIPRMAKQAVDARHVAGKGGGYVQAAGQTSPFNLGGEIGVFGYTSSCTSVRAGLMGLLSSGADAAVGGVDIGARVQTPTRLAPFAGVGAFAGVSDIWDEHDHHDYHCCYEDDTDVRGIAGVYPEVGVHYWLTGKARLSLSGSYLLTTEGRGDDFWNYGLTFSWLSD